MISCWSLATGGIGWDAPTDTLSAIQVETIPSSDTLQQAYDAVYLNSEFYGVFIQESADLLHNALTGSSGHLQAADPVTYEYQGGITIFLAVFSVTALAIAIGVAFRSALAAAFAWSLTLSTPLWLGLSHLDFKDIPVAAGLNLVTAGVRRGRPNLTAGVSPPAFADRAHGPTDRSDPEQPAQERDPHALQRTSRQRGAVHEDVRDVRVHPRRLQIAGRYR